MAQNYRPGRYLLIQLIGWLGCLYLLVKSLEIASSSAHRTEDGKLKATARVAALLGVAGSIVFFYLILSHGFSGPPSRADMSDESPPASSSNVIVNDCTAKARNDEEMMACNR